MQPHVEPAADSDAHAWLFGRINYERTPPAKGGRSFKLERMRRLLSRLDNPQDALQAVHVAGSKGKGSTAAMIAKAMTLSGRRTGLYTSPHLERIEERLCIDGAICSSEQFARLAETVRHAVEAMDRQPDHGRATFFEIVSAIAFLYFVAERVDVAVLEVGLGGRLDSTNVCHPLVSVITNVSLDHTRILGATLGAIAREKAGIIKPGVPVVSGVTEEAPCRVVSEIAQQNQAPLLLLGRDFDAVCLPNSFHGAELPDDVHGERMEYWERVDGVESFLPPTRLGLLGRHQAANAAVALATLGVLRRSGWTISQASLQGGVAGGVVPARVEVIARRPTVIIDTAHNAASIEALMHTLDERFAAGRRLLVFAVSSDKDVKAMLRSALPRFDEVIFTRYVTNPRAVAPSRLMALGRRISLEEKGRPKPSMASCDDPPTAWRRAYQTAGADDLICVTGSFFIAAELRRLALDATSKSL